MFFGKPFDEGNAGVQGEFDGIVALENIEKGEITFLISLLQDVPKIADGLMIVKGKNEMNPVHMGGVVLDAQRCQGIIGKI